MVCKQKDELIRLLEMYFIRTVGKAVDVNGIKIDNESWKIFAEILNGCGPPKHVDEWEKVWRKIMLLRNRSQPIFLLTVALLHETPGKS